MFPHIYHLSRQSYKNLKYTSANFPYRQVTNGRIGSSSYFNDM